MRKSFFFLSPKYTATGNSWVHCCRFHRGSGQAEKKFLPLFSESRTAQRLAPRSGPDPVCLKEATRCWCSHINLVLSGFADCKSYLGLSTFGWVLCSVLDKVVPQYLWNQTESRNGAVRITSLNPKFNRSHSRLCTPTHTGHRDRFGCPGVTAATELLNIRWKLPREKSRKDCEQNSKTEDEGRIQAAWRKREQEQKIGQRATKTRPNKKDNQMLKSE